MVFIGWRNSQSPGALEDRVRRLEVRVSALTEALRVLAHGLEHLPAAGPEGQHAAEAARQAYDLLLVADPPAAPRGAEAARHWGSASSGRPSRGPTCCVRDLVWPRFGGDRGDRRSLRTPIL